MSAYYNEIDAFAAQWLRNLIAKGLIASGDVDERSILDVSPDDVRRYKQCHFFAGIGGWSLALRLAGWPDDRPIWTGSCPCQPFSVAGKGLGTDDPRHLWPYFFQLISAVRPPVVMGEQVAGAAGYGWLDGVRADLERKGYASRGVDIPACAVDAPHIRQRLYWVAQALDNTAGARCSRDTRSDPMGAARDEARWAGLARRSGHGGSMDDAHDAGLEGHAWHGSRGQGRQGEARPATEAGGGDMADAESVSEREQDDDQRAVARQDARAGAGGGGLGHSSSFWSDHIWLTGADGKARRAEPSIPLLAHGIPGRVGRLRAYGNAIVPPLAAEVIAAFMECEP